MPEKKPVFPFHVLLSSPSSMTEPLGPLAFSFEIGTGSEPIETRRMEDALEIHSKRVYSLALRVTRNHHDAEDVFQEVFVRVWNQGDAFEGIEKPASWMYRVTLNLSLDLVERRKRSPQARDVDNLGDGAMQATSQPTPDGSIMNKELRDLLRRSAENLPRAQKEVFVLRNDEGLSYRDISQILQCPEDRARANFYQAMKSLRRQMQEAVR